MCGSSGQMIRRPGIGVADLLLMCKRKSVKSSDVAFLYSFSGLSKVRGTDEAKDILLFKTSLSATRIKLRDNIQGDLA